MANIGSMDDIQNLFKERRLFCFPREKSTRRRCGWSSRWKIWICPASRRTRLMNRSGRMSVSYTHLNEALQMITQFGKTEYHFCGRHSELWQRIFNDCLLYTSGFQRIRRIPKHYVINNKTIVKLLAINSDDSNNRRTNRIEPYMP